MHLDDYKSKFAAPPAASKGQGERTLKGLNNIQRLHSPNNGWQCVNRVIQAQRHSGAALQRTMREKSSTDRSINI
ncbi:unnamed protein product [Arctogadus glacialis]